MAKKKTKISSKSSDNPDAVWHLGETELEEVYSEFQHAVICFSEAFLRFAGKNLANLAGDPNLTGTDSFILHTIHSGGHPKSIQDILHFANRNDTSNVQYSVRKLVKAGLVVKAIKTGGRGTSYCTTETGKKIVQEYVNARGKLLEQLPQDTIKLIETMRDSSTLMTLLTGLYDRNSRLSTIAR